MLNARMMNIGDVENFHFSQCVCSTGSYIKFTCCRGLLRMGFPPLVSPSSQSTEPTLKAHWGWWGSGHAEDSVLCQLTLI